MSKYINEEKIPVNQLCIELEATYPNKILVNYTSYSHRRFEEKPTKCHKCQRFGDMHTKCKSNSILCGKCDENNFTYDTI